MSDKSIQKLVTDVILEADHYGFETNFIGWKEQDGLKFYRLITEAGTDRAKFIEELEKNEEENREELEDIEQRIVEAIAEYKQEEEEYDNMTEEEKTKEDERRSVNGRDSEYSFSLARERFTGLLREATKS